jgi:crotonobetainyl-CoA:carnitine CoA-transferase CaiB-like acyl-CoA transferase
MAGPLEGVRVLELATGVAGPYAGRLFAMLGATVVKAEPRGGGPVRRLQVDDHQLNALSPLYVHLNAGKRNVHRDGLDETAAMQWADIVLDDRVRSQWPAQTPLPRLLISLTAWGFEADQPGHPSDELVVQAASGLMTSTGAEGRQPLRFPGWQTQYLAGVYGAAAALALLGSDGPHHVDVAWIDVALSGIEGEVSTFLHRPESADRRQAGLQAVAYPAGAFACADGYVIPGTVRPVDWTLQCQVYGRPELAEDERFGAGRRSENREALLAEIGPWYEVRGKRDIFEAALEAGWALGMVMTAGDAIDDPHIKERGFLEPLENGGVIAARPWRAAGLDGGSVHVAATGEDTPWFDLQQPGQPAPAPRVSRLKVIELTWAWAGPFVGRFLGGFGADVIRVEAGRWPDGWRGRLRWKDAGVDVPPDVDPDDYTWDAAALFNGLNRNKRSVSVDLTSDEGRQLFLDLLDRADALVLNMTYSVLADRGVEQAVRQRVQHGLVVLNMPALGATGPYRAMPGYGMLMEGMGGFAARFGYRDEGARATATYYPDAVAGLHGSVAVLAALTGRQRTGRGSFIDLSQQETTWMQLGEGLVLRSTEGREVERLGNGEPGRIPSGLFPTSDGQWIAISDNRAAWANRDEMDAEMTTWTSKRTARSVMEEMIGQPVRTLADLYGNGTLRDRGLLEEIEHPVTGRRTYFRMPITVDGSRPDSRRPAPVFAQHTDEVLREWLGLNTGRIESLRAADVIGTTPNSVRKKRQQH